MTPVRRIILRSTAAIVLACVAGAIAADPPKSSTGLKLTTPAGWRQQTTDNKGAIQITGTAADPVRMRVQPIRLGDKVLTDEQIQKIIQNMAEGDAGLDPKNPPAFVKIDGQASGFSQTFTPAKQANEKQKTNVTNILVQLPGLALTASITHRPDAKALQQAIDVLRNASYTAPANGAAK